MKQERGSSPGQAGSGPPHPPNPKYSPIPPFFTLGPQLKDAEKKSG